VERLPERWGGQGVSEHYFSADPTSHRQPRQVTVRARGVTAVLKTDSGVFAKRGLDFGTRVLVEAVELPETGLMVDLGCGYGPVAAILARVYPQTRWLLLDVNRRALELAAENLAFAGGRIEIRESDGFDKASEVVADAVLLNPPVRAGKATVYRLFREAFDHLRAGGHLWVVIQRKQGADSAKKELARVFPEVETVDRSGGYHVICCTKG
jgi:16S rRNA (guanine1207-N2)-methyltransferase